jgi:tetratricopeptide (TPR) repeat protein
MERMLRGRTAPSARFLVACLSAGLALAAVSAGGQSSAPQASGQRAKTVPDPEAAALNDLLARAQSDIANNDYAAAADAYQQYLAKKPDDAAVHFELGYAYTALQKTADARVEFKRATELDPSNGDAFLNLGLSEVDSDPAAAVAAIRTSVELKPGDAHPKFMLGAALDRSGKAPEAIEQYKAAEAIDDSDPALHMALGTALLRTSHAAEAEPQFRAAIALEDDPQDHLQLAECLVAERKMDEAGTEFTAYLKANPRDSETRFAFAGMLIGATKYEQAIAALAPVSGAGPDALRAWKLRYEALSGLTRNDEAIAALLKAEAIDPGDREIHASLGDSYSAKKDFPSAEREYLAVLKLSPEDPKTIAAVVSTAYSANDYAGTLRAIDLQGQKPPLPLVSMFIRASCYDKLGQQKEALAAYEAFLTANKDQTSDMYFASAQRARDLRKELGNRK